MASRKQRNEEIYSCANKEVLSALFVGVHTGEHSRSSSPQPQAPGEQRRRTSPAGDLLKAYGAHDLSEDSSAEEEQDILRQHSRLMKQREFEQLQRDGYIQHQSQSSVVNQSQGINQQENSSRQNLVDSGSLTMQNSHSRQKQHADASPGSLHNSQMQQSASNLASGQGGDQQQNQQLHSQSHQNLLGHQNQLSQDAAGQQQFGINPVNWQHQHALQTPQVASQPDSIALGMGAFGAHFGSHSYRRKSAGRSGSKGGRKGRPISAYPVPGSQHGGFLSQVSESIESAQVSHLSRFTHGLAYNNASRKQYVPHNIETFEKEKLYTESIALKKQRNETMQQNVILKTNLKTAETDLRKKDLLITQLTSELKMTSSHQGISPYAFVGPVNQNSFMNPPPELQALNQGVFSAASSVSKRQQSQKTQQLAKQNAEFRKRVRELKCDLALKETEVQNLQRTLKFTRLKEFEVELHTYSQEILRLRHVLLSEQQKPRIDSAQFLAIQNQLLAERQQADQMAADNQQQRQDIEKLTEAQSLTKQKVVRSKAKSKKLLALKKRQDTKIKVLEHQLAETRQDSQNKSTLRDKRGSRPGKKPKSSLGPGAHQSDNECYEQLQTQLEINQILIDKLDGMGVDVRELIRSSHSGAVSPVDQGPTDATKMVIFTFVGPEGLIEGGDNQQFEMPIDFTQVEHVEQIKELLKRELVMEGGIDLLLREKQSGIELEQLEDVHIAVESGEGILVQFVEHTPSKGGPLGGNDMANINEEDEKSEYSNEGFEEEADETKPEPEVPRVRRIAPAQVTSGLKQCRLLLMIKKVPSTHLVKYLLRGESLPTDEATQDLLIATKTLANIFERKFHLGSSKATKMARFFVEGGPEDGDEMVDEGEHSCTRDTLIHRMKEHMPPYMLYNSLALESMLSRLQGITDGKVAEFLDDLNLDDEDSNGYMPFTQIQKVWKYTGLPQLDEELSEFLEFLALRVSPSLKKVAYEDFIKALEPDFTLESGDCQHEDSSPFDAAEEASDDQDLQAIQNARQADQMDANAEEARQEAAGEEADDGAEPEIESDDLMLHIDEALLKIVTQLPDSKKKTSLNKKLLPLARSTIDQATQETLLILEPQDFIQFMVQQLGVTLSDKELYCLLHILVREQDTNGEEGEQADGAIDTSTQGYIMYRDVYTLVRNYLRKEKIMDQSRGLGLDYQILTQATFDFLLRIKQALNSQEDKQNASTSAEAPPQASEAPSLREIFAKYVKTRHFGEGVSVQVIEFDDFFDAVFMKFKIRCPPQQTMDHLKLLLCVQFGPNVKEVPCFIVQKVERVLYDLDYVYVNLIKILREPDHDQQVSQAAKRLQQRYDFVSRGISKGAASTSDAQTTQKKQRPKSSKPRKEAAQVQDGEDDGIVDDDFGEDPSEDDAAARAARKEQYDRQKTKDIGFDLPNDSDDDGAGDDDGIDDDEDYEDDVLDDEGEDNEAEMLPNKQRQHQNLNDHSASAQEDDIDDDYSDDNDAGHQVQDEARPGRQETKTLKQIGAELQARKASQQQLSKNAGSASEDFEDEAYNDDDILDDYD